MSLAMRSEVMDHAAEDSHVKDGQLAAFLSELTALSVTYGIGISGKPVLFVLEQEDFGLVYQADAESRLTY